MPTVINPDYDPTGRKIPETWFEGVGYTRKSGLEQAKKDSKIREEQRVYELESGRADILREDAYARSDLIREDTQSHQADMWNLANAPLGDIPDLPGTVTGDGGFEDLDRPEYDPREAAAITQRMVAPQKRNLRQAYTEATTSLGQIANPNIQALTLRKALEGYGMGLESAMTGARAAAETEYTAKRKEESWASDQQARAMQTQYSTLLNAWASGKLGRQQVETASPAQTILPNVSKPQALPASSQELYNIRPTLT